MVDLPTVPDRIVTSAAPVSSVSRGDIIQNANQSAGAVAAVADTLMDVATRQAKTQAAEDLQNQKITRDADGNVAVANPANSIIFGRAGEAYHAAVVAGTVAEHSNIISREMSDIHKKFPTDPALFERAADAWKSRYLADHGGGIAGELVKRDADQTQTQHYLSISDTAGKIDLATKNSAITARQTGAQNDVYAALRGGASTSDPAVQSKIAAVDESIQQRAANPLFSYSKEQAALDIETFHSEAGANRFLFDIKSTYSDTSTREALGPDGRKIQVANGGYKAAMAKADDILTNPAYKLSPPLREQYYHRATAEIHTNEAIRKQDLGEVRAAFSDLRMISLAGQPVPSDEVERLGKAAFDAGDPGLRATIFSTFIRKPLNDSFGQQPVPMMNMQIKALQGMNAVRADIEYLTGKGYGPAQAAAMVSHIVHESAGDSSATGDGGTSGGLAQFHNERLTALKSFAAERGKPWTDHTTQLDFVDRELQTTEGATRTKLAAATTPEEAAAAFYDYERPAGWKPGDPTGTRDYQSRLSLARQLFDGKPADMSMGPAGSAWLIANRKATLDDAAALQWKTIVGDFKKDPGTLPPLKTVNDIIDAARTTGNDALLVQIAHDAQRMNLSRDAETKSIPSQDAAITSMNIAGHAGQLPPGQGEAQKDLQRVRDATVSGLADNPISHIVGKFSSQLNLKDKPALDFSSDEKLAQSLAVRGKIAQFGAIRFEVPPLSALDSGEIGQVQAMLASPDPAVKVRIFRAIGTLPEDVRSATLSKLGDKDPTAAVEVFAGSLLNQAPEVGASILTGLAATDDRFIPMKGQNKVAYMQAKDTALPVAAFNIAARANPTGAFSVLSQAMDARYTALSAMAGDTTGAPNRERLKKAAADVTGGILYHNGAPIIAPRRDMAQREFDTLMSSFTDADMKGVTTAKGAQISADYLRDSAKLHAFADGRYLVQVNADDANPLYAKGPDGRAWILDVGSRKLGPLLP